MQNKVFDQFQPNFYFLDIGCLLILTSSSPSVLHWDHFISFHDEARIDPPPPHLYKKQCRMQITLIASTSNIIIHPTSVHPPHLRTLPTDPHTHTRTDAHTHRDGVGNYWSERACWMCGEEGREGGRGVGTDALGAAGLFGLQPRWMLYRRTDGRRV